MTLAIIITVAVLAIVVAAWALIGLGARLAPGSRHGLKRQYQAQRADLRSVLPDRWRH